MADDRSSPPRDQKDRQRWEPAVGLYERLGMLAALTLPLWLLVHDVTSVVICAVWQVLLTAGCLAAIVRDTKDGAQW